MAPFMNLLLVAGLGISAGDAMSQDASRDLVFSLRTWEGDYFSRDIAGGVETTPIVGAIYTIAWDGSGLKKIAQLGKNTDFPTYSPDGRWIYFQSNAGGRSQIYRCRPDGKDIVNLTRDDKLGKRWRESFGYALSTDGGKLLYTVHDGSIGQVAIAEADGSSPRLLAPRLGYIYMAALSPKMDRVAFSGPARGYRLFTASLPDGQPRLITPDHPESFVPQFTPDGKTIIFLRRDGDLYRIDADGGNPRRLTKGNDYVEFKLSPKDAHGSTDGPHISPDGKRIAYIAIKKGVASVCIMDLDGSEQRQLTFRNTASGRVRWAPDGKEIAFVSFEGKYPQLFVISAEGGRPRQLTDLPGAVYFVNWRPASSKRSPGSQGAAPK